MKPYKAPYKDHGGRHHPVTGSDPIPNLSLGGGMVWATLGNAARVSVPSAGNSLINMNSTIDYTNDPSVFGVGTVVDSGSTYHGIACLTVGHYLLKWQLIFDAVTADGGVVSAVVLNEDTNATPAAYGSQGRVFAWSGSASQDGWYLETLATVTAAMTKPFLLKVTNGTGVSLTCDLNMIAFQLDTDGTVFF